MMDMVDLLDVAPLSVVMVAGMMIGLKALLLWEGMRLLMAVRCWVQRSDGWKRR